jgi:hypothetical protein
MALGVYISGEKIYGRTKDQFFKSAPYGVAGSRKEYEWMEKL